MTDPIQIITTGDGSHSLLNTAINETYHSIHGAITESRHVFIENGLHYFSTQHITRPVRILEIGFGTGLNALLTAMYAADAQTNIHYSTLEAFPLPDTIWQSLNYADTPEQQKLFFKLHEASWNVEAQIHSNFTLRKVRDTLQDVKLESQAFDLIYYDAFAPAKQPEMWEVPMLKKIEQAMHAESVFVTYCAKGQLKRDLKLLGMRVDTLAGPPGKKEMVRAVKVAAQRP
jgi:tRNA U34 5-methylaminomethyl-2-thiouridine-forming methyltransferase MnmC